MPKVTKQPDPVMTTMSIKWYSKLGKIMKEAQKALPMILPGDKTAFDKYYNFCYTHQDLVFAGNIEKTFNKDSLSISLPIDLLVGLVTASGTAGAKFVLDVANNLKLAQDLLNGKMQTSDNFAQKFY